MPKEFDCHHCGDEKTVSREGDWCKWCVENDRDDSPNEYSDDEIFNDYEYDDVYYDEDEHDEWEDEDE